jgi:hypothetical protein
LLAGGVFTLARGQDESEIILGGGENAPPPEVGDSGLHLVAHGHAEAISSGVVLEYIVRVPAEDGAKCQKAYSKKLKELVKSMEEDAPVTTLVTVETHWAPKFQANGMIIKPNPGGNPSFKPDEGFTFTGRFFVGIHGLQLVPRDLARKRLAQVMQKLSDCELTGAEDDVDIIAARMEVDTDALKQASEADAMKKVRKRAAALAALAGRKLGRATLVRESYSITDEEQTKWGSNYYNFVFPGATNGWNAPLVVTCETEIEVGFELE